MKTTDDVTPKDNWEFDADVTRCFDDMLSRSIPQYDTMRRAVFDFQKALLPRTRGRLVDLGTSRGESVARALEVFEGRTEFVLVDESLPMIEAVRERFKDRNGVRVERMDLRTSFPDYPADVFQAILTLQFTPINYRQQLIQRIYDNLRAGGGFIFVEKVLGAGGKLDTLQDIFYHALKNDHGYTREDISSKAESLENVLVPVTAQWNEQMLRQAGFRHVDCFWRWMKFAGWIAIK